MSDNLIPMLPQPPEVFVKLPANDEAKATANPPPMTADDIRHKILEQFTHFQPHIAAYHEYAERIASLSVEYHNKRLRQVVGDVEEGTLLVTLDARETPKSLDAKLDQLKQMRDIKIKHIIFDRVKAIYYLFI